MKKYASVLILILLLSHPAQALAGARQGLVLWSQTVLPTLLPFMICSNVIVAAGGVPVLMAPFRPILERLLHLSADGGYVLVSGLLCGYPMGAKTCSEFLESGRISAAQARRLLAVSNHPSPMFVMGYLASCLGPDIPLFRVLTSLYLPIIPLAMLAKRVYPDISPAARRAADPVCHAPAENPAAPADTFDRIMMRSVEVMVRIGGYIMLFSILAVFIERLPFLPPLPKAIALGLAEITTGIQAISRTSDGSLRGLLLTAAAAFGGLSGILQTRSVILPSAREAAPLQPGLCPADASAREAARPRHPFPHADVIRGNGHRHPVRTEIHEVRHRRTSCMETENAGLSIRHYILWKILHTITACLLYILPDSLPALLK